MSGEPCNKGAAPFMPRKSLDKRFTDNPLDQERNKFLSLPYRRVLMGQGTGPLQVHRAESNALGGSFCDIQKYF